MLGKKSGVFRIHGWAMSHGCPPISILLAGNLGDTLPAYDRRTGVGAMFADRGELLRIQRWLLVDYVQ